MSLSHHTRAKISPSVLLRPTVSQLPGYKAATLPDKPPIPPHPTPYPNSASPGCTQKCDSAPEVRGRQGWQHGTAKIPVKIDQGVLIVSQTHVQTPLPLLSP